MPARLVVLASGGGSNLQAVIDACESGAIPAQVSGVVCNRRDAYALERARRHHIPADCLTLAEVKREGGTRVDFDRRLADRVAAYDPDLVVLAGFMHILSPAFLSRFAADGVINLHPSLLPAHDAADADHVEFVCPDGVTRHCPAFRGHTAVAQAIEAGVPFTGTCVHYVTAEVDRGPVIAQVAVPVHAQDTVADLQQRIQAHEHRLLPQAIAQVLAARAAL